MTFSETEAEDKKGVLIFNVAPRSIDPAHPRPPKRTASAETDGTNANEDVAMYQCNSPRFSLL